MSELSAGKMELERIVYIGRTFGEYMRMFDLQAEELHGRSFLDCPAGACSFTAEVNRRGGSAVAADLAYSFPADVLQAKGTADLEHTLSKLEAVRSNFRWEELGSVQGLKQARMEALTVSSADRLSYPERYVYAELPVLPFAGQAFDVTLSAHFLFMYGDRLGLDFHLAAIEELMRVTQEEIRIFPLTDLSCRRYEHLDEVIRYARSQGWTAEEVQVPYEFQLGANSMLRMKRI